MERGIDCLDGSAAPFGIPAQVAKTFSLGPWRTPKEVEALANPPAEGLTRDPAGVYFHTWRAASAHRGYNPDIQTYSNPFAAENPGQPQVTTRTGEALNLVGRLQ